MTDTIPPPGGQPQALTAEREAELRADHQCSDVDTWCRAAGCKQDWPCATAQLLAALDEARSEVMRLQDNDSAYDVGYQRADAAAGAVIERLRQERDEARARLAAVEAERDQAWKCVEINSTVNRELGAQLAQAEALLTDSKARATHFSALATDQQRLNEAMVASLQRGLEKLQASEAECARLRKALQVELDEVWADVQRLTYHMSPEVAESYWHSPKFERLYAALAATDRGRAPAGEAVEAEAPAWAVEYVAEHPKERESRCRCKGCQGPPFCRCCNGMLGSSDFPDDMLDDAPPAPADQARREGEHGE